MDASRTPAVGTPAISVQGITKTFGHVLALDSVHLNIWPGEVVGLVGDNGAGKSTLIKILSGTLQQDEGFISIKGQRRRLRDAEAARRAGIETVYQDLALAPDLDAVNNLYLGREVQRPGLLGSLGLLNDREMRRSAPRLLGDLSARLPALNVPVGRLSGGQRQLIAVARATAWAKHALLMDEPTSALGAQQTIQVHGLIRIKASQGLAVVLISHDLSEVLQIVNRVVVLRLGSIVADRPSQGLESTDLLGLMTGLARSGART